MAIERSRTASKNYSQIVLFRDELEQIEQAVRKLAEDGSAVTTFSSPNWSAESLDEIIQHERERSFTQFELAHQGIAYLRADFGRSSARLYVDDVGDARKRGVFDEIDEILRRARRPWVFRALVSNVASGLYGAVAIWGVFGLVLGATSGRVEWAAIGLALLMVGGVAAWVSWNAALRRNSVIVLESREARPSFVRRNRDQLALSAISATLGAVIGSAVTYAVTGLM